MFNVKLDFIQHRNQSKLEPKKESVQRGLKGRGLVCDLISKCFVLFSFGLLS